MSDKIVKKVENLPQLTAVKRTDKLIQRVAAYARVSTGKEEQQTSIVAQKEYYTDYIKSHAGWQFVGLRRRRHQRLQHQKTRAVQTADE